MDLRKSTQQETWEWVNAMFGVDASEYERLLAAYTILESAMEAVIECEDTVLKNGSQQTIKAIVGCCKAALAAAHQQGEFPDFPKQTESADCRKCGRAFEPDSPSRLYCVRCESQG